jgi:hypothetical protein
MIEQKSFLLSPLTCIPTRAFFSNCDSVLGFVGVASGNFTYGWTSFEAFSHTMQRLARALSSIEYAVRTAADSSYNALACRRPSKQASASLGRPRPPIQTTFGLGNLRVRRRLA